MKRFFARIVTPMLVLSLSFPAFTFAAADNTDSKPKESGDSFSISTPDSRLIQDSFSGTVPGDTDVLHFLTLNKEKLSLSSKAVSSKQSFIMSKKNKDEVGKTHYVYQQSLSGVPVYGSYAQVNVDSARKVYAVQNSVDTELDLSTVNTKPKLAGEAALQAFKKDLEIDYKQSIELETKLETKGGSIQYPKPTAKLIIYPYQDKIYLAYEVNMSFIHPAHANWVGYVDANTGAVIDKYNKLQETNSPMTGTGYGYNGASKSLNIIKYTYGSYTDYELVNLTHPGMIFTGSWYELDGNGVPATWSKTTTFRDNTLFPPHYYSAAVDAHYNTNLVYNYYKNTLGRDSIDGNGMDIFSLVNVPDNGYLMDNAFWDGSAMYYGDGSGVSNGGMNCTSCALDIVAHEITHGVTQYTSGLEYRNQSGALNESFSDIMGVVIDSNDWDMGEDSGMIGRSLQYPARYGQPGKMSDSTYWPESNEEDNGGVHTNSGIPNHAAYLMVSKIDGAGLSLNGRTTLGKLTYAAMQYLFPTADFMDARFAYLMAVDSLPGLTSQQVKKLKSIVIDAWAEVGISYSVYDFSGIFYDTTMSATFNWSIGSGATSVAVQQSTDGGYNWTSAATSTLTTAATTATVSHLLPGKHYLFRLVVVGGNSAGNSNLLSLDTPNAKLNSFTNTAKNATTASFAWTEASDASAVEIQKSTDGGTNWTKASTLDAIVPNATGATVTNLTPNTAYKFRLLVTGGGYGGDSNVVDVKTDVIPITDLKVSSKTGSSLTFSWTAATGATSVILQQSTNGTTWTTATTSALNATSTSATVTGLLAGTALKFRLSVTNGYSAGYSNVLDETTLTVPVASFALKAAATTTSASFTWAAAVRATSIVIEQSADDGENWKTATASKIATSATTATVTGLTPNTSYQFRLKVVGGGNAGTSTAVGAKTVPVTITTFANTAKAATTASFKWTPSAGSIATTINVEQSTDLSTWVTSTTDTPIASNSAVATVTNLIPNKAYSFRLKVDGGMNEGISNVTAVTTIPQPIAGLARKTATTTSISMEWTPAIGATAVVVQQSTNGTSWTAAATAAATGPLNANASSATVTGLLQGAPYKFRLLVTGGQNAGNSAVLDATTESVPVANFTLKGAAATTSASFTWTAAVRATSIVIEQSEDGGSSWKTATSAKISATATTATVTGLKPNTAYKFRLKVVGGANDGTSVAAVAKTVPVPITTFANTAKAATTASFKWTPSAGSIATTITVEQSTDLTTWVTSTTDTPIASNGAVATVTGLTPNKLYSFRLKIDGGMNEGISNVTAVTTIPQPIADLARKTATLTEISLEWTPAIGASAVVVQQSTDGTKWTTAATTVTLNANASSATVTGLLQGAPYKFRLLVTGGQNVGNSAVLEATTQTIPVENFVLKGAAAATSASFTWKAAVRATSIVIEQSEDGGENWKTATSSKISATATTATVTGLKPNTIYQFRLKVVGGANGGTTTAVVEAKTAPLPITTFANTAKTATTVSFNWTPSTGSIATTITVEQSTDLTTWVPSTTDTPIASNGAVATVTGLTPNKPYSFRLRIDGGMNEGISNVTAVTTNPQPITDLAIETAATTSISLHWTPAIGATAVIIQQSTNGTTWKSATTATLSVDASSATVTGLLQGAPYKFRLVVTGGQNAGNSAVLDATTASVPVANFALKSAATKTSVIFTWTAAVRATSIVIEQSTDGGVSWKTAKSSTISTSVTTATVTGLTANTAYQFRLKVVGGANAGTSTSVVETKTST
ncbi:fibronectin type III domain-containing protein [Paenibacillus sp. OV219]|uniref:fibronectin type III domain-containing protein n=1 Tax=Paenibacillus sp. OV219 TaxID=1884377 RepID=UPI0008C05BAB|nr:fibronectin type III domain-containing protein [Paenibacillus sp. OV219]SEO40997.1 Zn-dependent metalloprotease [Paenibacillus sp. OV219]